MRYEDFERTLKKGELLPAYVLHGPEEFFKREAMELLRQKVLGDADPKLCFMQADGEEAQPADIFDELRTRSFFGGSKLVVIRNAGPFLANHGEALLKYLKKPSRTNVLLLLPAQKPDGRTAVGKALSKGTIECLHPYDKDVPGWLAARARKLKIKLDRSGAQLLAQQIGADLMQLDMQLEKLATLAGPDGTVTEADVVAAVGHDKLVDIFKLTDAVADGQPGSALETLHRLLQLGDAPERVLGMLAWQFRKLRRMRRLLDEGVPRGQLAKKAGINPFFLDNVVSQARRLPPDALIGKQRMLHQTDWALKTRSENDGGLRLTEELVVRLCN